METIVGTAGHIDHGKTALVKALTGIDADRLPEEKRRGITVDLGFAEMRIGETHFGFVDVPGHEKFVRNMLAGASGIDLVLLVVAADEGVMPQTLEHFDICRLLNVKNGVIALTKSDLVDAETLDIAKLGVAELVAGSFLENAPVVAVSSRTGHGMEVIREKLAKAALQFKERDQSLIARLPIDRSFSIKGFGTVVTGTLASGEIFDDSSLELMPERRAVRIRGLQTHGATTLSAKAGQRTAVNLGSIDHESVTRGMTLVSAGALRPTQIIDTEIEVLSSASKALRSRQRVRVHLGTAELLARIKIIADSEIAGGGRGFVQIRLESPAVAVTGERLIIRSYSPQVTIAGGVVLDPLAEKHRHRDTNGILGFLTAVKDSIANPPELVRLFIEKHGDGGASFSDLQARTGLDSDALRSAIDKNIEAASIVYAGGRYLAADIFAQLTDLARTEIETFHAAEPLAKGIGKEALRERACAYLPREIFSAVVAKLESDEAVDVQNDLLTLASRRSVLYSPAESAFHDRLLLALNSARLTVPRIEDAIRDASSVSVDQAAKLVRSFVDAGEIVKVTDEFYFARVVIRDLVDELKRYADTTDDRMIDVTAFKALADVSRKYAIPLLEYFDRVGVTRRAGDNRVVAK